MGEVDIFIRRLGTSQVFMKVGKSDDTPAAHKRSGLSRGSRPDPLLDISLNGCEDCHLYSLTPLVEPSFNTVLSYGINKYPQVNFAKENPIRLIYNYTVPKRNDQAQGGVSLIFS